MITFPPDSGPAWIIAIGLAAFTVMFVVIRVAVPTGYGIRGLVRFVKRRAARKANLEKAVEQ
jgi:hypothetical protein